MVYSLIILSLPTHSTSSHKFYPLLYEISCFLYPGLEHLHTRSCLSEQSRDWWEQQQPGISQERDSLDLKIQTDLLAGRGLSYKYKPTKEAVINLIKNIRSNYSKASAAEQEQIVAYNEEAAKFLQAFSAHYLCTDELDSLSAQLLRGELSLESARNNQKIIVERMQEREQDMVKAKAEIEAATWTSKFGGLQIEEKEKN